MLSSVQFVMQNSHFRISGGVNSLISLPYFMSHASIHPEKLEAQGLTKDLVRISVGIEDVDDSLATLDYSITNGPK